ncbi:hypothetical protein ES703_96442 [subsurface metagenome]
MPQQYQSNELSSPPSVYGFPRDASQEINASKASGRELAQQQTKQSEVGDSIRELAGQKNAQSAQSLLQQSKFKDILKGQRTYPLGSKQGDSQQEAYSKSVRNEPTIYIRNLPWVIGQRLWVREKFAIRNDGRQVMHYAGYQEIIKALDLPDFNIRWKPSIHMPRWASRILLEITDIRVERLQEITGKDCILEGIPYSYLDFPAGEDEIQSFAQLWDSLNAKRGYGWETNLWVWVISFKRLK